MSDESLTSRQMNEIRSLLEDDKQKIESQLKHAESDTKPVTLDQQSVGRVSRIDAIQQQQMAIASQQQAAALLRKIELALQRMDSGEYGYCMQCEEPIAYGRLQAQPHAGLCLDCQSQRENPA